MGIPAIGEQFDVCKRDGRFRFTVTVVDVTDGYIYHAKEGRGRPLMTSYADWDRYLSDGILRHPARRKPVSP